MKNMAWKTFELPNSSDFAYWNYREEGEGATLEGTYIDMKEEVGKYKQALYIIERADGVEVGVNGCTVLDRWMKMAEKGDRIKITYLGKKEGKSSTYHDFEVAGWEVEL